MIENIILSRIQSSLDQSDRQEQRNINNALKQSMWILVFPMNENPTQEESENQIYTSVYIFFGVKGTKQPKYIPGTDALDIWDYEFEEGSSFEMQWPEIAVHMKGSIWFESSKIKPAKLKPIPFSTLDDLDVIDTSPNAIMTSQVLEYMHGICDDDYTTESFIDEFFDSLEPNVFRIDNVYVDISGDYIKYGRVTGVIRYHNEVIGYVQRSGRELIHTKFFMKDYSKYTNFLEYVIDICKLRDRMVFSGALLIDNKDADEFVAVPGITKPTYEAFS